MIDVLHILLKKVLYLLNANNKKIKVNKYNTSKKITLYP